MASAQDHLDSARRDIVCEMAVKSAQAAERAARSTFWIAVATCIAALAALATVLVSACSR